MQCFARLGTNLLPLGKILSIDQIIQAGHGFAALEQEYLAAAHIVDGKRAGRQTGEHPCFAVYQLSIMICLIFTQKKYITPRLFHPRRIRNTILQLCCAAPSIFENIVLGFQIPSTRSVFISGSKQIRTAPELP
jgi:hypothetical protein